ncbi:hypothetical protein IQ13_2200 [Lacibacter cauensis]|uniref:Uncharacterized protein n=1 Tax=Lacibacter cauensis TaxID=510947 RepID=A0A562SJM2_9BACT|nr:hypothetical protein [Lacibacter cauensis]TWI81184.1 hypothetical protein IQ13_2200 [Lacibacter cauensis]
MGDLRTRNANRWANYVSFFPVWGKHAASAIRQNALSKNQQEQANAINPIDPTYQTSPFAQEQLDTARQSLNARMPGAATQENNLYRSQANSMMNLARAANPQQLIAAAGAVQNNTENALNNLAVQEAQYRTSMLGNLNNALQVMTGENDKIYGDQLRKFDRDFNYKQGLLNSAEQNRANVSESISNGVTSIANTVLQFAGNGGFNKQPQQTLQPVSANPMSSFNPANIGSPLNTAPQGTGNIYGRRFSPSVSWFTPPQANYTPTIYGRP